MCLKTLQRAQWEHSGNTRGPTQEVAGSHPLVHSRGAHYLHSRLTQAGGVAWPEDPMDDTSSLSYLSPMERRNKNTLANHLEDQFFPKGLWSG